MERRLKRLGHGEAELALSDFLAIPEVADNPFLPKLFDMADSNCDGYLTSQDLHTLMLRLIELRDPEAKFQFVFQMYDADDDGLVTREDLVRQLLETNSRGMATDNVESIAQATLEAFDYDGDGALNYGEFVQLITSQRPVAA